MSLIFNGSTKKKETKLLNTIQTQTQTNTSNKYMFNKFSINFTYSTIENEKTPKKDKVNCFNQYKEFQLNKQNSHSLSLDPEKTNNSQYSLKKKNYKIDKITFPKLFQQINIKNNATSRLVKSKSNDFNSYNHLFSNNILQKSIDNTSCNMNKMNNVSTQSKLLTITQITNKNLIESDKLKYKGNYFMFNYSKKTKSTLKIPFYKIVNNPDSVFPIDKFKKRLTICNK